MPCVIRCNASYELSKNETIDEAVDSIEEILSEFVDDIKKGDSSKTGVSKTIIDLFSEEGLKVSDDDSDDIRVFANECTIEVSTESEREVFRKKIEIEKEK